MSLIKTSLKAIETQNPDLHTQNPDLHKYLTTRMLYELLYIIPALIIIELAGTYLYCQKFNLSMSILIDDNFFSFFIIHILSGIVIAIIFLIFNYHLLMILNHKEQSVWYVETISCSKKDHIKNYFLHTLNILSKKSDISSKLKIDKKIVSGYLIVAAIHTVVYFIIIDFFILPDFPLSTIKQIISATLIGMIYTYAITSLDLLRNISAQSKYEFILKFYSTALIFLGTYFYATPYQETIFRMQNIKIWSQINPSEITKSELLLDRVNYFVAYDRDLKYSKVYQKSIYDWQPVPTKKSEPQN